MRQHISFFQEKQTKVCILKNNQNVTEKMAIFNEANAEKAEIETGATFCQSIILRNESSKKVALK